MGWLGSDRLDLAQGPSPQDGNSLVRRHALHPWLDLARLPSAREPQAAPRLRLHPVQVRVLCWRTLEHAGVRRHTHNRGLPCRTGNFTHAGADGRVWRSSALPQVHERDSRHCLQLAGEGDLGFDMSRS